MRLPIKIQRIVIELPTDIDLLANAARAERIHNIEKLKRRWDQGLETYCTNGAALFGAFLEDNLLGVCGTTRDVEFKFPAMRMKALYVHPDWRRQSIASTLAKTCMFHGLHSSDTLTCNARASAEAGPFWVSMGFKPVYLPNITHVF